MGGLILNVWSREVYSKCSATAPGPQVPQFAAKILTGWPAEASKLNNSTGARHPVCLGRVVSRLNDIFHSKRFCGVLRLAHVYAHHTLRRPQLSADR